MVRVKNLSRDFQCETCGDGNLFLSVLFGKQKLTVSYVCPVCGWGADVCEIEVLSDELL